MTQSKAQTVASALIALGQTIQVLHDGAGNYTINSSSDSVPFTAQSVATFATTQGVVGTVTFATFS
jgi:hypothetical protein